MSDAALTQRCYVCDAYFSDKVKLGLHIALCYSQAVQAGRTDLPQPAELLNNEKRYTEFMRDKRHLDEEIAEARRQKVSFATREDFSAMRSQLSPDRPTRAVAAASPIAKPRAVPVQGPRDEARISGAGHQRPSDHLRVHAQPVASDAQEDLHASPAYRFKRPASGAGSGGVVSPPVASPSAAVPRQPPHHVPPPQRGDGNRAAAPVPTGHSQQPAMEHVSPPQQQGQRVSSGVTMLRNELQSELANVREFMAEERRKAAERDRAHGAMPAAAPAGLPAPVHERVVDQPIRAPPPPMAFSPERPPSSSSSASPDSPDQRVCPNCGKSFGKRGYAVHTARCGKHATEDFTYSKDAQHPDHRISEKPTAHAPGPRREDMTPEQWQQFMVTYPRPVIDEAPKTAAQRAAVAAAAAQRREMMMHAGGGGGGGGEEPRQPCGRCGRMFLQSRVRQHEAVCVADPRI
uniref:Uncharacterized protein n=1 Tax=Neobodo designis TaxID=312471 RepID=A0A7S1M656_NEODS|mmetsp:Transcript_34764/g.107352  ORF Transcript_34764/g.107352 Transcript_34764/m.107352 type:complete len:461 (+) Transcript_34764:26-1408(+)